MDRGLQIWFIIFAAATTVAAVMQLGVLVVILLGMRRLGAKLKQIRGSANPQGRSLHEIATTVQEALHSLNHAAKNVAELTERIKPIVDEAAGASHKWVTRVDQVLGDTLSRIEKAGQYAEQGIIQPIREVAAISAAVRSALTVLFQRPNGSKGRDRSSGSLRGWFIFLAISNLAGFLPLRLRAQQAQRQVSYEGQKVALVDLVVRPGMDVEALRPLILQKAGEPYSNERVQSSVAALKQTGGFNKVDVEVTPEPAGLRVAFVIQPAFYIGMIDFPGAVKVFSYPRLLQVVNYPAQEPYEASRVKGAETDLLQFFTNSGYFQARVETETKPDQARGLVDVVFYVALNRRAKFGRVEIAGASAKETAWASECAKGYMRRLRGRATRRPRRSAICALSVLTSSVCPPFRK